MTESVTSVLLVAHQLEGRAPTHCVVSGRPTDFAVRVSALQSSRADWLIGVGGPLGIALARVSGRPTQTIVLPVEPARWKQWRRRVATAAALFWFGVGTLIIGLAGLAGGRVALSIIGAVLILGALVVRVRSFRACWVSAELRPAAGHVVIRRAHSSFDRDARQLFASSFDSGP